MVTLKDVSVNEENILVSNIISEEKNYLKVVDVDVLRLRVMLFVIIDYV